MTAHASTSAASAATGSTGRNWLEWLWRGQALRQARLAHADSDAWEVLARTRAAIALEVGEAILNPPSAWRSGNASHLAAGLFAEAIAWSLRLVDGGRGAGVVSQPDRAELESLLAAHHLLLLKAVDQPASLPRITHHLLERDFASSAGGPDAQAVARELALVATRLLTLADAPRARLDALLFQRTFRTAAASLVLLTLLALLRFVHGVSELRSDLTLGKRWVASSASQVVCQSPQQACGQSQTYFFSTNEDASPWLEIDLEREQRVSRLWLLNRKDCCAERALPLVVEVSTDHKTWREVIRRNAGFDVWRASFDATSARYIRFRVARRSILHLGAVRVFQ